MTYETVKVFELYRFRWNIIAETTAVSCMLLYTRYFRVYNNAQTKIGFNRSIILTRQKRKTCPPLAQLRETNENKINRFRARKRMRDPVFLRSFSVAIRAKGSRKPQRAQGNDLRNWVTRHVRLIAPHICALVCSANPREFN